MNARPITRPTSAGPRSLRFGFLLIASVWLYVGNAAAQETDGDRLGATRAALEKWVETRRIISKEKSDWELGRRILEDRIGLIERQIESLRKGITEAEKSIGEADKARMELTGKQQELKEAAAGLEESIAPLEERTLDLLVRLPDPIRDKVEPLSQSIPQDPEATDLGLGDRFQFVVGVLNEVDKFNREITVTSEIRELGDGNTAEVTALYAGIAQGWYVGVKGDAAGIGIASEEGWTWTPADAAAERIAKALAIRNNETLARFIRLPIRIR